MQCIVPEARARVEEALTMYETTNLDGKDYRVHRDVSRKLGSSSHDVTQAVNIADYVHAIHTSAGWQCKVPQCGATFDHEFTIDLHLWAHGVSAKWYCGEPSCPNGPDQGYIDRHSFGEHVAVEHMNSDYSFAAARRAPRKDVLVAGLWRYLKLARVPKTTAVNPNSTVDHTVPSSVEDDICEIPDDGEDDICEVPDDGEDPTWNGSRSRHVADQLARSAKRAEFARSKRFWKHEKMAWEMFRMAYDMEAFEEDLSPSEREVKETLLDEDFKSKHPYRWVSLWSDHGYWGPDPLNEEPGVYFTETLTYPVVYLDLREARMFDKSCRALCDMLGTKDRDVLWPALSQMILGLPPTLELDIDFVDFDEDFEQDSNNIQSTQTNDTGISEVRGSGPKPTTVLICPWPGCECRKVHTHSIIVHSALFGCSSELCVAMS
ncbi:hypothetical protein EDD36DRAFT_281551 [Exophiala viscosa]|uniref:C2H2-type domain-containing protein n=1 Tax=Exophiala viscosa TaxID=2486360 RepID=A0AAN6IE59_9EURO|nr:hypothetical protein EDD36DRAFT_281551 [Exophiala viscosa]